MSGNFTQLRCKEVICVTDGRRLGYVADVRIALPEGKITALVVPCPCRLPFTARREDFVIPWSCICRIGPDIILVNARPEDCRVPRHKSFLPF